MESNHFRVGEKVKIAHEVPAEIVAIRTCECRRSEQWLTLRMEDGSLRNVLPVALNTICVASTIISHHLEVVVKTFLVGGMVRDRIMGIPSKDADFSCVLEPSDFPAPGTTVSDPDPFAIMRSELVKQGFKIFVESPEHFTIRAQFSDPDNAFGVRDADFVLARKEGPYSDGRRPDWVDAGTLEDDLARRDFCFNAIAVAEDGSFVDPYNGRQDIAEGVIRPVGKAIDRFTEDALRAVRALRFSVTKGFRIDPEVRFAMEVFSVLDSVRDNISDERIEAELSKMFRFDTVASLRALQEFPALTDAMFSGKVSLDATMKTKGRGR